MAAQAITFETVQKLTDGELIVGAISGRSDGFEELVRRYQRPITSYVFRMLGDYESALDVTQEVFIKVYNSLTKYSAEYKFSTWLYRIAHNAAIDHMRRNSVCPQSLEAENADGSYQIQIESRRPSPEKDHELSEWRNEIASRLWSLTKRVMTGSPSGRRALGLPPASSTSTRSAGSRA